MESPTIITAFFDIGRGEWNNGPAYLNRTTDQYFQNFERLLKLTNPIVVHTSWNLQDRFRNYQFQHPNLTVICWENWRKDIWPEFFEPIKVAQKALQHTVKQPWNPEYWNVDYVMVNMLKSYFVNYSIELGFVKTEMAAWIDFGYARKDEDVPSNLWMYTFDPKKIHMFTIKQNCPPFMNLLSIIENNDVWITGCHIVASKKHWRDLMEAVYFNIKDLLSRNLIDDDQTILYMCYCLNSKLFEIHKIDPNDWFCIFRKFNNV